MPMEDRQAGPYGNVSGCHKLSIMLHLGSTSDSGLPIRGDLMPTIHSRGALNQEGELTTSGSRYHQGLCISEVRLITKQAAVVAKKGTGAAVIDCRVSGNDN